jgi:hypothetical protein
MIRIRTNYLNFLPSIQPYVVISHSYYMLAVNIFSRYLITAESASTFRIVFNET